MRFSIIPAAVAALVVCLGLSAQAHATLVISVNGVAVVNDPTNTFVTYSGANGNWNINQITMAGVNSIGGSGTLVDNSSLNISTTGLGGPLTILLTETGLSADTPSTFLSTFTGSVTSATATRSFYIDPTNSGLMTTLLGSTSIGSETFAQVLSLNGQFSVTEQIVVTATGQGAFLSADDNVKVPEPTTLGILGVGMLGLGTISRRRRKN